MAMTIEQQRALVMAKARLRLQPEAAPAAQVQAESLPWYEDLGKKLHQAGSGILEGAVGIGNLPMETVRAAGEVVGIDPSYLPLSTAEINYRNRQTGFTAPEPQELGDKAVRFTGEVIGGASLFPASKVQKVEKPISQTAEALFKAGKSGYAFPRSNIKPTWMNQLAERFGGKQAIEHAATTRNQSVTNELAAKALGLPKGTPITQEVLKNLRTEAGKAYEVIKNIGTVTADKTYRQALSQLKTTKGLVTGPADKQVKSLVDDLLQNNIPADKAIETVKQLRYLSKANIKSLSPAEKALGKAQLKAANAIEELIERNIEPKLGKEVLDNFRNARQLIAKTYTVENSLNPTTGNVVANKIAQQAKYQKLSGELKDVADYARINPRLGRELAGAPPSGGLFEPLVYGGAGTILTGPGGAAAAAIPILGKPLARKLAITIPKQTVRSDNALLRRGLFGTANALLND